MSQEENNEAYISIEDAAELVGFSIKHLKRLISFGAVRSIKKVGINHGKRVTGLEVAWSDVKRLANSYKPFWVTLPDNALLSDKPDANFLLYGDAGENYCEPSRFINQVKVGNCIDWMRKMPSGIVQSVVTSPPYWGVRKYPGDTEITWSDGTKCSFGEEQNVETYVTHTLEILRHLKRILKDDGTIWWNLGDTYQTRAYLRESSTERLQAIEGKKSDLWSTYPNKRYSSGHSYLKDKDLTLFPFMVALGAERIGLYVRSMIIWSKENVGLDSADDRPVTSHEYIILLAKSRFYKYYPDRETETAVTGEVIKRNGKYGKQIVNQRKLRSVWRFATSSSHGDHVAAFPFELPRRCLKLSTDPGDLVFDPFTGSGTTLAAAKLLQCDFFGIDIVPEFVQDAERRLLAPNEPLRSLNGKPKPVAQPRLPEKKSKYKIKADEDINEQTE